MTQGGASTPSGSPGVSESAKHGNFLFLALIAGGLAGNYFKFPIFLGIDFLFGSIFSMLALQFLGLRRGVLTAAVVSGSTYFLWNHPFAVLILTAEVAVVGWRMGRPGKGMVFADAIYWLVIGMPLAYLTLRFFVHLPQSNVHVVVVKLAVNGIANALFARLIFTVYALRSRAMLLSYREIVYNLLALFVLAPALLMLAIGSRVDFAETDLKIRNSLVQDRQQLSQRLRTWVVNRRSTVVALAELAASKSPKQMQPFLEQARKSDTNILRIGLHDREATTTAYSPLTDELGQATTGRNFADRPFLPVLKRTLKPMLSEVAMSRTGIPKPRVAILAPVSLRGEYGGYVFGSLAMDQIREYLEASTDETGLLYTLLDKNGNIIMTNRSDQKVMSPLRRGEGILESLDHGIHRWLPAIPPDTPFSERWRKSYYVAETAIGDLAEWKLVIDQPVAPYQKILYDSLTGKLTLLFLILVAALALANWLSREIIDALEKLNLLTRELPARVSAGEKEISWPESGILEAAHLIGNFREMTDMLSAQFRETRKINETLELRVEERTAELKDSLREKETLLKEVHHRVKNNMAVISALLGLQANELKDPALAAMFEESRQRIKSMALIHEKLYATASLSRIDMAEYVRSLVDSLMGSLHRPGRDIVTKVEAEPIHLDIDTAVPCGLILNELVTNVLKHAFEERDRGEMVVSLTRKGEGCTLGVRDDGIGLPRGVDPRVAATLGLKIVDTLARQLHGDVRFTSGAGTEVTVTFNTREGNRGNR
jgi:two-component system cell cycle sensor histidine kinase/response regulator CckA